jgi:signal transduction histidine kinase/ligand-binding sensor domain-containing protein
MPLLKFFLPYFLLFTYVQKSTAQSLPALRFEKINGLSQNTVYSIMKDKQGFMWLATADGLNRYDGVEMKIYKPQADKKAGQLKGRTIRTIVLEDTKEQLWFSTELAVFNFNKKRDYFTEYSFGEKDGKVLGLMAEPVLQKGSKTWFTNSSYGLIEFDTATKAIVRYELRDSSGTSFMIQTAGVYDNKNRLWFACNKGLFAFNIVEKKWQQFLPGIHLYKIALSENFIYASSGREVYSLDINSEKYSWLELDNTKSKIENYIIQALYADKHQNIWAGDAQGNVYCKTKKEIIFRWKGNINGEKINQTAYPVYCFYADEQGTLWVGADVLGLLRATISSAGFNIYPLAAEKKKAADFFVTSIYEDENDKVWLGTFQMGMMILDKKTGNATPAILPKLATQPAYGNIIGFIKKDSSLNIWIGTAGHLLIKTKGSTAFTALQIPMPPNTLALGITATTLTNYKEGWLVGTSLGLYFLTNNNGKYVFNYLQETGQSKISDVWIDNETGIWIGFENAGLFYAKAISSLKYGTILFSEFGVKSFFYDKEYALLWVSTQSGFISYHIPTGKNKIFNETNGLGNSYVYGALKNGSHLWLSTNRGLSKAVVSFKKGNVLPDLSFTNFTSSDGLPDDEFNTGAFYKGKTNTFYFGTIKGLVWFNPDQIKSNQYLPQMVITAITVNGEPADSTIAPEYINHMLLPYLKNSLFFRFRGIEYSNASKVNYAYQLEGWDKDWVNSGTLNEVRYNNLPPGNYLFKVKSANASGIWNEKAYTISVIIYPPFWKTWWFYLLEILTAAGIIILVTKTIISRKLKKEIEKLERQKALEEERLRISQEMHDDIGAGLTQISLISEAAKGHSGSGNEVKAELEDISSTSRKLVDNISEIIWALNPGHNTLDNTLAHLREQLGKLLEYAAVKYTIHFPVNVPLIELNDKQRRNIILITKEITHNALKHSKAGVLTITGTLINHQLKFIVKDDGVGFNNTTTHMGNGLKNIRRRIEELQGNLIIESESGEGTVFTYSFTI